jgi:hypothetical protein
VAVDRDDRITPASLGLSIAEGKAVLAAVQARVVVDQVKRHSMVARQCLWCGCASRIANSRAESRIGQRCAAPDV